ncbi:tetratricopeptide repeat protein [Nonomuraea sp. NN258]|uniref:FxSxx-COOH system tetratricopeptide repeat protein n=1 Tax=Nonomuraea antri TaxID=2730852 RepID=UPI001569E0F7|nr:FxSxx-COOH system tetratricopeptide repeat protein [Nonomuraea antri]NRQ32500.1 tetratricopeptide repeat protein [Nonomuraea antri]
MMIGSGDFGASGQPGGVIVTFYSVREGIGRTMAVANLAVLLASEGLRVLVIDADGAGTPRYLRRLTTDESAAPAATLAELIERWDSTPGEPEARAREDLRAGTTRISLETMEREGGFDFLSYGPVPVPVAGSAVTPAAAERLRAVIRAAGYDYVLVDGARGTHPSAVVLAAGLSDMIIVCHTLSPQAIEESVTAVERIRATASRPVRIMPLPMRVDLGGDLALRDARELSHQRFSGLADPSIPAQEIPYQVDYYFSETLAVVNEPPDRAGGLRQGYERLAEVLTDGRFTALAAVAILYTAPYRDWAEWIDAGVKQSGVQVTLTRLDRSTPLETPRRNQAILIVSPPLLDDRMARRLSSLLPPSDHGAQPSNVWQVRVDDSAFPEALDGGQCIDLRGLAEETAAAELRRRLHLTSPSLAISLEVGTARFPRRPGVSNTLGRNPSFVGRDDLIDQVRDHLLGHEDGRCLLTGAAGLGKSQIAMEYAHRFGGAYDLVWWVSGSTPSAAREALSALSATLGLPTGGDAARAALGHLVSGEVSRWLLVYDDVDDPVQLRDLLPDSSPYGHVIITSRGDEWPAPMYTVPVGRFTPDEGAALVRIWVPRMSDDDARKICDIAARLPIAVQLAAAWLRREAATRRVQLNLSEGDAARSAAARFLVLFEEEANRPPATASPDEPAHRITVELALASLRGDLGHGAAVWLAEACAFLSPEGIDLRFLRSPQVREGMAAVDARLADPTMTDAVLRSIDRHGLARVDLGRHDPLRMHRLIQTLIRDRMSAEERHARNAEILRALAVYAPEDLAAGPPGLPVYAELAAHVVPSGAAGSSDPLVRTWVINQMRYLLRREDYSGRRAARQIGDAARTQWENSDDHTGLPELRIELSNAYRQLGEHREAADLAAAALHDQARSLGTKHPRTLITAMDYAVALRTLGGFDEAYTWDDAALKGLREIYGADHSLTGRAMNNLAVSYSLRGDSREAIRLAEDRVKRRTKMFGEYDPAALWTKCNLASYLRDAGDYQGSYRVLKEIQSYLSFIEKEPSQISSPVALRVESGLAVTERMLGNSFEALYRDKALIGDLRELHGPGHLFTLMCRHSLAADLYAQQQPQDAVNEASACLDIFKRTWGEHPFTHVCQMSLAVYLRGIGDLERSRRLGQISHERLRRDLGPRHPYALAAAVNLAGTLVRLDELDLAFDLERDACLRFTDMLGADHTYTRITMANVADTQARLARPQPAAHLDGRGDIDVEIPAL